MDHKKRISFLIVVVILTTMIDVACAGCRTINHGGFMVDCVKVNDDLGVEVICLTDDWTNFPRHKLDLPFVAQISFRNCSFPRTLSLLDIINSLKVNSFRTVHFEQLSSLPNRPNLQGISTSRLQFVNTDFSELSYEMLYDVLDVEMLAIEASNLVRIPKNFFKNWAKNLRRVSFMHNQMQNITKDDFAELIDVTEITLYNNTINAVERGAFDNLSNLTTLELGGNRLGTLPSGIFRYLSKLERISLSQNPIDELPQDLLTSIEDCHLQSFRMNYAYGSLRALPNGFFKNLATLENVELIGNQLKSLSADLFAGTSELVSLSLADNKLMHLSSNVFDNTKKLKKLDLSNNLLETLPGGIFKDLSYLGELDISYNRFNTLMSDVLIGLNTLKYINASHNNLMEICNELCSYLKSVEIIDLSYNQLTFERQDIGDNNFGWDHISVFLNCMDVRVMNLSHNKVSHVFDDWVLNVERRWVDLSNNQLTELSVDDISNLNYKETIDLRNNEISKIDLSELSSTVAMYNEYNSIPKNMRVILGNNPLRCDCHLVDFVEYLAFESDSEVRKYVMLTSNGDSANFTCASPPELANRDIRSIRSEDLSCLLETSAADDACTNTCTCREYPKRQVLSVDCSYKNLAQLPAVISNLRNWSIQLNMSHNMLHQNPILDISYRANVISLDLSSNYISQVSVDIFTKSLVDLKLHDNNIARLDTEFIEYLTKGAVLRSITLHDNKWICDCESRNFYNFVQEKAQIYKLHEVTCSGTNDKMYAITVNELCDDSLMRMIIFVSFTISSIGIVISSMFIVCYRHQEKIKMWPNPKLWYLQSITKNELDKGDARNTFISISKDFDEKQIIIKLGKATQP